MQFLTLLSTINDNKIYKVIHFGTNAYTKHVEYNTTNYNWNLVLYFNYSKIFNRRYDTFNNEYILLLKTMNILQNGRDSTLTLYGFYTDESGNNGFNDLRNQPILCYAGFLVPLNKQIYLHNEVQKISDNLKKDIKLKIHGIPSKTINDLQFFKNFEIHGKPFIDGEDFYYNLEYSERFKVVEDLLTLLQDSEIKIVASITDKHVYQTNTGISDHNKMHLDAYTELVNLINIELRQNEDFAFVICDDGKPSEISNFYNALKNPSNTRVYPDLQIKESHDPNCNLIQLADLVNFITSVYFRQRNGHAPRKRHQQKIIQFFTQFLQSKLIFSEYK